MSAENLDLSVGISRYGSTPVKLYSRVCLFAARNVCHTSNHTQLLGILRIISREHITAINICGVETSANVGDTRGTRYYNNQRVPSALPVDRPILFNTRSQRGSCRGCAGRWQSLKQQALLQTLHGGCIGPFQEGKTTERPLFSAVLLSRKAVFVVLSTSNESHHDDN